MDDGRRGDYSLRTGDCMSCQRNGRNGSLPPRRLYTMDSGCFVSRATDLAARRHQGWCGEDTRGGVRTTPHEENTREVSTRKENSLGEKDDQTVRRRE